MEKRTSNKSIHTVWFDYIKSKGRQNPTVLYWNVYMDGRLYGKAVKDKSKVSIVVYYTVEDRDNDKQGKYGEFLDYHSCVLMSRDYIGLHIFTCDQ